MPEPTSEAVRRRMESTRQKNTPAELAIRSALHRRGLRYRVDQTIPGVTRARPDIVFTKQRIAVFVDGCFWHSCPKHSTTPKSNQEWWVEKLAGNVERDRRHDRELVEAGWRVLRFWEHEDPEHAADAVERAVQHRRM